MFIILIACSRIVVVFYVRPCLAFPANYSKTITLHLHYTFWYIFCRFFYVDDHVKFPNFTFEGGRNQMTTNFLSLLKFGLNRAVRIRLWGHCGKQIYLIFSHLFILLMKLCMTTRNRSVPFTYRSNYSHLLCL